MNTQDFWAQKIRTAITVADCDPSEHDLADAPVLNYWRPHVTRHGAPSCGGWRQNTRRWSRTASRWYVLAQHLSAYEAVIVKGLRMEEAPSGFV
jgi:hypothetical protein